MTGRRSGVSREARTHTHAAWELRGLVLVLQEAKEDAEMDAEIALEMALERERKLSASSKSSSVGGAYVGPCPHSPGQVGWGGGRLYSLLNLHSTESGTACAGLCGVCRPLQEEEEHCGELLSSRKMSVSRMHSLPNDSYMFRPVRPASAPYRLEEVELSPQHQHAGDYY